MDNAERTAQETKELISPRKNLFGAIEGTRTPTPLPVHGPEPCASANSATMAIWNLLCSGGRRAAVSGRPTVLFYRPATACQTRVGFQSVKMQPAPDSRVIPASLSSKFLRSAPSIRDSPFPPPPHISETPLRPLREPCRLHRCGSM